MAADEWMFFSSFLPAQVNKKHSMQGSAFEGEF